MNNEDKIKELEKRIEYLERKVSELDRRTFGDVLIG